MSSLTSDYADRVQATRKEPTISGFVFFEETAILVGRTFAETISKAQNFAALRHSCVISQLLDSAILKLPGLDKMFPRKGRTGRRGRIVVASNFAYPNDEEE